MFRIKFNLSSFFWVLILIACLIRFLMAFNKEFYADELYGIAASTGILKYGWPQMPAGAYYSLGGPLLYLYAVIIKIFGINTIAIRLIAVLFSSLGILIFYRYTEKLFGQIAALLVAFFIVFDIDMIMWGGAYSKPYFFTPVMLVLVLGMLQKAAEINSLKKIIFASLLTGLTVWVHPLFVFYIPGLVLAYLVISGKINLKNSIVLVSLILVFVAMVYWPIITEPNGLLQKTGIKEVSGQTTFSRPSAGIVRNFIKSFVNPIFTAHYYRQLMFIPYLAVIIGVISWILHYKAYTFENMGRARNILALVLAIGVTLTMLSLFKYYHFTYTLALIPLFYILGSYGLVCLLEGKWLGIFNNPDSKWGIGRKAMISGIIVFTIAVSAKHILLNLKNTKLLAPYEFVKKNWKPGDAILGSNAATYLFAVGKSPVFYYYTEYPGAGVVVKNGIPVERYFGGEWIGDSTALQKTIDKHQRIWFIGGGDKNNLELHFKSTLPVIKENMKEVYHDNNNNIVYLKE